MYETNILMLMIQFIGIVVPIVAITVLFFKEQGRNALMLMLMNVGCLILNSCYLLLLQARVQEEAMLAMRIENIGNAIFFFFFVFFILLYYKANAINLIAIIWGTINVIYIGCLWIERLLPLIYSNIRFERTAIRGHMRVAVEYGPLSMVRLGIIEVVLLVCIAYTYHRWKRTEIEIEKRNVRMLGIAQVIVFTMQLISLLLPLPMDLMPFAISISNLIIVFGVINGRFFNVAGSGKDWLLEEMGNIYVIVDNLYGYLESNKNADRVFGELLLAIRNKRVSQRLIDIFLQEEIDVNINDKYYERSVKKIEDNKGNVVGYSLLLRDVTKQHLLMEEVRAQKQRAEEANEAKSAFMSNMSHEIRTPMNAIVGMTEILMRRNLPEQEMGYLENIKNSGNALLTIINDILDFSKIESGKLEIVEEEYEPMSMLNDLSMIFLNRIGNKNVELLYDIDKDLPEKLFGDALRIRQILINFMNNATKFTQEGFVKLIIRVKDINEQGMNLYFAVEDSGQGIKEEDLPKLFQSFQQVDTKRNHHREGTGLGLAISKQLTELMGGTVGVESTYGVGSTFHFTVLQKVINASPSAVIRDGAAKTIRISGKMSNNYQMAALRKLSDEYGIEYSVYEQAYNFKEKLDYLFIDSDECLSKDEKVYWESIKTTICKLQNPMLDGSWDGTTRVVYKPLYSLNFCRLLNHESMGIRQNQSEAERFIAPGAHILIVDDNEMNLKVAMGLLEPLQMQIDTAVNGKQALEMISDGKYDLIFMDHMMPIMDGEEATRHLRNSEDEYCRNVPVIALTANAFSEAKKEFLAAGMNDFLAKPIKMKEICRVLKEWLPEELIEYTKETTLCNESESDNSGGDIPEIEGLNVAEGIENSGSMALFMSLLADFYHMIDMKAAKIEKCLADNMIRDYTIEVHALKNTARMIGAMELSSEFYQLEQWGNDENTEELRNSTAKVLEHYRSYKPILLPYAKAREKEKNIVDKNVLISELEELINSADEFDLDKTDAIMDRIEGYAFPEECLDELNMLRAYIADVNTDEAIVVAKSILSRLQ